MIAATAKKKNNNSKPYGLFVTVKLLERAKISSYVHETGSSNATNDPFLNWKVTELLFCDDRNRNENAEKSHEKHKCVTSRRFIF